MLEQVSVFGNKHCSRLASILLASVLPVVPVTSLGRSEGMVEILLIEKF